MSIVLYGIPASPRTFKTLVAANHLGIDYRLHVVEPGGTQKSEFTGLNINRRVPVLQDGDYLLWESNAILEYLASKDPSANLMPEAVKPRLQVTKWLYWDQAHWDAAATIFIFERFVKKLLNLGPVSETEIARGMNLMPRLVDVLEKQLEENRFIAADHLTLADFAIAAPLTYAQEADLPIGGRKAIARWLGEMQALPAWRKAAALQVMPKAA